MSSIGSGRAYQTGSVHQLSNQYVDDYARLDPITATLAGVVGYDDQLTDYSPEGHQARADLRSAAVRAIGAAEPADESERVAKGVFLECSGTEADLDAAGQLAAQLNVIDSPPQNIRTAFDLMSTGSAEDWAVIARRLTAVPEAIRKLRTGLRDSADSIEEEGIRRARARAASADLKLVVLDATKPEEAKTLRDLIDARTIVVVNKIDLVKETPVAWEDSLGDGQALYCSIASGEGIAAQAIATVRLPEEK